MELFETESTTRISPRTGTARIILLSLPNRIFWNFSHKPLFHNAISHSVRHSIIRSFPMVWIFFLSTNRNYLQRNQLSASYPRTGTAQIFLLSLPNRIFWNFSHKPLCHNAISHRGQTLKNWVSSDGLDFFPINKPELLATESTIGTYPRTGNAYIVLLSLPNRIFWNFSHKPLFHNAISHSVRHSIIRSFPMVWIFFLSTNRNYLQRNQLSAPTLGPETLTQYFYLFQIESSGYFSHKPLFHNAISHSVRHSIIRSFPMVWIFFLSTNRNYLQRKQLSASTLGPEPHRYSFYLFQI